MPRPRITAFISATSSDLRGYRDDAHQQLRIGGIVAHVQEDFEPTSLTLEEYLRKSIVESDVIICLVGFVFGAEPLPTRQLRRSFTQLEMDLAIQLEKPLFVFLATKDYERCDNGVSRDSPEQADLQRDHWQAVQGATIGKLPLPKPFSNRAQLSTWIAQTIMPIYERVGWRPIRYVGGTPGARQHFVGRTQELQQIHEALSAEAPAIIAVVGMGGQGKTTLVYQALSQRHDYWFGAGVWITAEGRSFDEFLEQAVCHLVPEEKQSKPLRSCINEGEKYDLKQRWKVQLLDALQQRPTLIVIDGVERWLRGWGRDLTTGDVFDSAESRRAVDPLVDDFLREVSGLCNHSHVVITTRALPVVLDRLKKALIPVHPKNSIDSSLPGLAPEDAIALLRDRYGIDGSDAALAAVAERYGFHPMALDIVGAQLQGTYGGDLSMIANLERQPNLLREINQLFDVSRANLPGGASAELVLKATSHAEAELALEALYTTTQGEALGTWSSEDDLWQTVINLANWNLLTCDRRRRTVAMHGLLQSYYRKHTVHDQSRSFHRRLSDWYEKQPLLATASLDDLRPRLLALEHAIQAREAETCHRLLASTPIGELTLIEWLAYQGHYSFGIRLLDRVLEFTAESDIRHSLIISQAAFARQIGKLASAIQSLSEAISRLSTDQTIGDGIALLASAHVNRGNCLRQLSSYGAARRDYDCAVELWTKLANLSKPYQVKLAQALQNRGCVLRDLGCPSAAADDASRAIELIAGSLDPYQRLSNPRLAHALADRGNAFFDLRCTEKALADYKYAEAIFSLLVQDGRQEYHLDLVHAVALRAGALRQAGHPFESLIQFDRALSLMELLANAGREDLDMPTALIRLNRAMCLARLDRYDEAKQDNRAAIDLFSLAVRRGLAQCEGLWAHALLSGAVMHAESSDWSTAAQLWKEGRALVDKLCASGQTDVEVISLRYLGHYARACLAERPEQAVLFAKQWLSACSNNIDCGALSEALRLEALDGIEMFENTGELWLKLGLEPSLWTDLHRRCTTSSTHHSS